MNEVLRNFLHAPHASVAISLAMMAHGLAVLGSAHRKWRPIRPTHTLTPDRKKPALMSPAYSPTGHISPIRGSHAGGTLVVSPSV